MVFWRSWQVCKPNHTCYSSSPIVKDPKLDFAPKDIAFVDLAFANFGNLPTVYNYIATLVEMLDSFKQRLLEGYQ